MSIASEIQALSTNLTAAKNAVTAKGGTVGDTGLAGLATEIASIPSGGSITSYGTIKYTENGVDKTIEMATEEDFIELAFGTSGSDLNINNTTVNKDWIKEVTVGDGVQYLPDTFMMGCTNVTTVNLPSTIHYIGDGVFQNCAYLNSPITLTNVVYIGSNFMQACARFNQSISLPKIERIENNFLYTCSGFNSSIVINDNCRLIGSSFLDSCTTFAQPISIPSGLETAPWIITNPGSQFLSGCYKFTGPLVCNGPVDSTKIPKNTNVLSTTNANADMYTIGVTLTGPYAAEWKAALPDRTSSPYRKLIVAS